MGSIISFFANTFGYVLNYIYNIVNNYGLTIIIFTVLLKLLMLPMSIKQQKTMKKNNKIQEKSKEIQALYANDPKRSTQEVMKLYKEEKMSPFSGCLGSIVQIFIILSIFFLVSRPLTYMKKIDPEVINNYKNIINGTSNSEENKNELVEETTGGELVAETSDTSNTTSETSKNNNQIRYIEIAIIKRFAAEDERLYINMNFLGLDLSDTPVENMGNWKVYIIPLLYIMSSFASMKINTNMSKKAVEEKNKRNEEQGKEPDNKSQEDMMLEMNNNMIYIMPLMTVSIALIAPLGLALYWFVSNFLMLIEKLVTNKFLKDEEK